MKTMQQRTAIGRTFGVLWVAVTGCAPAGYFTKDVSLYLINKNPRADADFFTDSLLCCCEQKGSVTRHGLPSIEVQEKAG